MGLRIAAGAVLAGTAWASAAAQDGAPDMAGATPDSAPAVLETYPPDYFALFQPESALDMVAQVPGFTLRGGSSERGFGEANTNFLINGRRPSTKSQSARDILSRIPADSVKRIELLDGATLDLPGLTGQVINIVYTPVELSGRWEYAARFEEGTEPQILEGELVLSGKRGDLGFSLLLNAGQFTFTEDGTETFRDGDGVLVEDRLEDLYYRSTRPGADLNLTWTPQNGALAGHVANLNGSISLQNLNSGAREIYTALVPDRVSGRSEGNGGENDLEYEIGGDYALPVGIGTLKLIGLFAQEEEDRTSVFINAPDGQIATRSAFLSDETAGETVARTEYSFALGQAHDIQLSAEYAFNFLESDIELQNNFDTVFEDSVRVEEDRYNARVSDSWQISPALSLQTSLGAEFSKLQVTLPASEAREFFRPKGFAALSYQVSPVWTTRARVERGVGQLNFGTFVDSRSLVEDVQTSGNEDIKPDQFWEFSAELERTDDSLFSGRIRPYLRLIEDPIDRVLFDDGTEGPGNLDDALRYGVEGNATLLFDTLGVKGLRFEFEGQVQDSEIDDPLTGETRELSQSLQWAYEVEARYDIPDTDIALFSELENDQFSALVRFDETRIVSVERPYLSFGVLHKDLFGLQVSIEATNLLDNVIARDRVRYFDDDLRLGEIGLIERFERRRGRRLSLEISSTF